MSDFVGGCILFPPELDRTTEIRTVLKAMELAPDEFEVRLPDEGVSRLTEDDYPLRTVEPPEYALQLLAEVESGLLRGEGSKSPETYWIDPCLDIYPVVTICVVDSAMFYDQWPEEIEFFAKRWLQLCEQGQAVFGYFVPFEHMFTRSYLEEQFFPAVDQGNFKGILDELQTLWLLYLGPELAARFQEKHPILPASLFEVKHLPSGALFIRVSREVFH